MSQPNALHKNKLRQSYLIVGQSQHLGALILFALPAIAVGIAYYFGANLSLYFQFSGGFNIPTLQALSILTVLILLLVAIISAFSARKPTQFKVQTYSLWPRILFNLLGCLLFLLVSLTLLLAVYEYYLSAGLPGANTPEATRAHKKVKALSILMAIVIFLVGGLLVLWLGSSAYRNFKTFWRQVRLTGYFDQDQYQPGSRIRFMLKDRQSLNGTRRYRAHLNFVVEKMQGSGDSKGIVRQIERSFFQDCTAGELHMGIDFTLPEGEHSKWHYTRLSKKELPQYWEIMLEGEDRLFFARFFVNVTKPDRRLVQ